MSRCSLGYRQEVLTRVPVYVGVDMWPVLDVAWTTHRMFGVLYRPVFDESTV